LTQDAQIPISADKDVVLARQQGRLLALQLGFSTSEATLIAMAISELSRNIVSYAGTGTVTLKGDRGDRCGAGDSRRNAGHARRVLEFGRTRAWIAGCTALDG
jgi:serine/threonine-protein kinase RsbT